VTCFIPGLTVPSCHVFKSVDTRQTRWHDGTRWHIYEPSMARRFRAASNRGAPRDSAECRPAARLRGCPSFSRSRSCSTIAGRLARCPRSSQRCDRSCPISTGPNARGRTGSPWPGAGSGEIEIGRVGPRTPPDATGFELAARHSGYRPAWHSGTTTPLNRRGHGTVKWPRLFAWTRHLRSGPPAWLRR
jgi:hypothetical protein